MPSSGPTKPSATTWPHGSAATGPTPISPTGPAAPGRSGPEDLPVNRRELADALRALEPELEPVPAELLTFLSAPDGLNRAERIFYSGIASAGALVISPSVAPLAGVPGRGDRSLANRLRLQRTRVQLRAFQLALGPHSPSVDAARYRLGLAGRPEWLD